MNSLFLEIRQPIRAPQAEKRLETVSMTMMLSPACRQTRQTTGASPAVDEFAVRLVADEEQIVLLCDIDEHLHLLVAQHNAVGLPGFVTMMARVCSLMSDSIFSRSA